MGAVRQRSIYVPPALNLTLQACREFEGLQSGCGEQLRSASKVLGMWGGLGSAQHGCTYQLLDAAWLAERWGLQLTSPAS